MRKRPTARYRFLRYLRILVIGAISVFLVTIGIDAADHYDNFSSSIIGRLWPRGEKSLCPAEMIYVLKENGGFCLDKYEASPGSDCVYQNVKDQGETRINLSSNECQPVAQADKTPWRFISQSQATEACAKAGKRLPTSEEWYLGSLGTIDKDTDWSADDCQVNKNWKSQPGLSGSGKNCVSAAGAYDMIGNVWEWVKGEIRDGYYEGIKLPAPGYIISVDSQGLPIATDTGTGDPNFYNDYFWIKETETRGLARGGYWENKEEGGIYSMYLVAPPTLAGTGMGFRCVK